MEEMTSSSSEGNKVNESGGDDHSLFVTNPCNYFQQFIRAVLKCLGFQTTASSQLGGSSSSELSPQQPAEPPPPSTAGDPPPSDPTAAVMAARIGRRPPKPVISGGPGPQTNANPTS